MFHSIPPAISSRMQYLETIDIRDRSDNTPRMQRLRQIPPETGRFIALLASGAPYGSVVEVGTSAGYSTLWLALTGRKITTFEILPEKVTIARETFHLTGMEESVTLVEGDARDYLAGMSEIAFCFLDAEKEVYADCYELVIPRLVPGGLLVADNAISHREAVKPVLDRALADTRVDALIVPIGTGELVCRKV